MNCLNCGTVISSNINFCPECGKPTNETASSNSVNIGDGSSVEGSVFQAGRDIFCFEATKDPPSLAPSFEHTPKWRSPITQAVLGWASLIIGLFGIFPVIQIVGSVIAFLKEKQLSALGGLSVWPYVLFFIVILVFSTMSLRQITKKENIHPLFSNWALSGTGHSLNIEQIEVGECPECGGQMKYYNKPIEWADCVDESGKLHRKITKRVQALECKRNPEHSWSIDPATSKASTLKTQKV